MLRAALAVHARRAQLKAFSKLLEVASGSSWRARWTGVAATPPLDGDAAPPERLTVPRAGRL